MYKYIYLIIVLLFFLVSISDATTLSCGAGSLLVVYNEQNVPVTYNYNANVYTINKWEFQYQNCQGQVDAWLDSVAWVIFPIVGPQNTVQSYFTQLISFVVGSFTGLAFVGASLYKWS